MVEDVRRLVGRNVNRTRIAAGFSQAYLAERMGVEPVRMTIEHLERIEELFVFRNDRKTNVQALRSLFERIWIESVDETVFENEIGRVF